MGKLLTAEEVSERYGLKTPATVYRWGSSGKLRRVILGTRAVRFREEDVEAFIVESSEGRAPDDAPR